MVIRLAIDADYPQFSHINQQVHKEHFTRRPDLYSKNVTYSINESHFRTLIRSISHQVFVVQNNRQKIIAYAIIQWKNVPSNSLLQERNYLLIHHIAVLKEFRHNGVGNAIMKYLEKLALQRGAKSIELNVLSFNNKAIAFYESLGMTVQSYRLEKPIL